MTNGFIDKILDVLFPARCPWCDSVLGFHRHCKCEDEISALLLPAGEVPTPQPGSLWLLKGMWACLYYEEPVRSAILRMKFENERNLAVQMGSRLFDRYSHENIGSVADVLVPVPVSPKTADYRGYNQSALVAWELAGHCGVVCRPNALVKVRETVPQSELGRAERLTNVVGAYSANAEDVKGKRVLLVDDILTTGSTINECAGTLYAAGAAACYGLCIAASGLREKG